MANRRRASILVLTTLLTSCGNDDAKPATAASASPPAAAPSADHSFSGLAPLPGDLLDSISRRHEYVSRIELDPSLAQPGITATTLRDSLRAHQKLIEATIRASRDLHGALPPPVEFTDEEVSQGLHLLQPRAILLAHSRLLRTDAVRCWEANEYQACADRFVAALDIAAFLLGHDDEESRFRGGQTFGPALLDLDAVCEAGFAKAAPKPARSVLAKKLRSIDPTRCLMWDDASKAGAVRDSLLRSFPE